MAMMINIAERMRSPVSVNAWKNPKARSQLENITSPTEISAPIRIRSSISSHHLIHFRTLYQTARHRKARNIGYTRREMICPKSTRLEAPPVTKNGEPVVVWAAVYAMVTIRSWRSENPKRCQNENRTFLVCNIIDVIL
jgi:hypothetical protein